MDWNAGQRPTAPSRRRGYFVGVVIGCCATLVVTLATAWMLGWFDQESSSGTSWHDPSEHTVSIDTEHLAVELTVPGDLAVDRVHAGPFYGPALDCRILRYRFGGDLVLEAFEDACEIDSTQRVINGRHGFYRTLDDVPEPVDVSEVATDAGPAEVFVQEYAEYTNSSNYWDEPVAIVTLSDPVDSDFPTLVLRSDKGELSREELTKVVASLSAIED